jgi:hypothetical protein
MFVSRLRLLALARSGFVLDGPIIRVQSLGANETSIDRTHVQGAGHLGLRSSMVGY